MEPNYILKEKVKNVLDANLITNDLVISVLGSEVTLQGIVNSYDEKDKIEIITRNIYGVDSVNNELSIYNEN